MRQRHIRAAFRTLRHSKWRSLMTMTGIILGVVSVITTVSLGEGIKRQVLAKMSTQGSDLITIRPGSFVERDANGVITGVNNLAGLAFQSGSLADSDVTAVATTPGVRVAVPLLSLSSGVTAGERQYNDGLVIATDENFPEVYRQELSYGNFYDASEKDRHVAVIGKRVAENVFGENVPIGRSLTVRGQSFVVIGVFDDFAPQALGLGPDYNTAVFLPYGVGRSLGAGSQLAQILARPTAEADVSLVVRDITRAVQESHGGQNDFTVLRQDENVAVIEKILNNFTMYIAGIAGLSLLIGGIGIMNIMFVAVTERTREIGIRKALGATNRQIAHQFFAEAAVMSVTGGLIGVVGSFTINFVLRVMTPLEPVITWQIIALATGTSLAIGIVFGIIPAVRAARKDPIQALRYE